jgi:hypothetical protein
MLYRNSPSAWTDTSLVPRSKPFYIATVLLQQGLRAVFRVALEMYEQALLFLLHKRVHSALDRLSQYSVAARSERICLHFIPSGVRETNVFPGAAGERMVGSLREVKNSELFVSQRMAADAVAVQNACVSRQTGQTVDAVFRSAQSRASVNVDQYDSSRKLAQRGSVPVMITPSTRLFQRSSVPEVEAVQVPLSAISPRNPGQRVQLEEHRNITRCDVQKIEKLQFSVFQRRVRHIIDER